jgi:hypothetical protein
VLSTPVPPSKQQGGATGAMAGCATAAQATPEAQRAAPLPDEPAPGLGAAPGLHPAFAAGAGRGRGRGRGRGGGRGPGRGRGRASLPPGDAAEQPWAPSPAAAGLGPALRQEGAAWAASLGLSGLPAGLAHALAPGSARAPGMLYACPAAWAAAGRRAAAVASAATPAALADLVLALLQQAAAAGGSGAPEPGAAPAQRAPLPADSRLWLAEWRPPGGLPAGGGPPPKKKLKGARPCARCLRVMRRTRTAAAPAGVAAEGRCACPRRLACRARGGGCPPRLAAPALLVGHGVSAACRASAAGAHPEGRRADDDRVRRGRGLQVAAPRRAVHGRRAARARAGPAARARAGSAVGVPGRRLAHARGIGAVWWSGHALASGSLPFGAGAGWRYAAACHTMICQVRSAAATLTDARPPRRGVLGDRRRGRGRWAGSVLDAVVGVFLTQNVSDALSSKAWMTLAAAFPLRPPARRPPARSPAAAADGPAAPVPAPARAQSAAAQPGGAAAGAGAAAHPETTAAAAGLGADGGAEPGSPRGCAAGAGPASDDESGPGLGSPHTPRTSAGAAPGNAAAAGGAAGEAGASGGGPGARTPAAPASADLAPARCGDGEAAGREAARQPGTPPVKEGHRAGLASEARDRELAAEGRARPGSPPAMPADEAHPTPRSSGADPAGRRQSAARSPASDAAAPGPAPASGSTALAVAGAAGAGVSGACEAGASGGALARRGGAQGAPGAPGGAAWDLVGADAEGGDYGDSIDWEAVRTAPMEKVRAARLRPRMRAATQAWRQLRNARCDIGPPIDAACDVAKGPHMHVWAARLRSDQEAASAPRRRLLACAALLPLQLARRMAGSAARRATWLCRACGRSRRPYAAAACMTSWPPASRWARCGCAHTPHARGPVSGRLPTGLR